MRKNKNIEITRILDIVKSKKLVILFILIIFTLLGYVYSYHYVVPKYKATSTLLLIPNSTAEGKVIMTSDLTVNADLTVNSGLIETYRSIGENSKIAKQVIYNLALDMTEEELLKDMQITVMKDTYLIQVAVTSTDPQKAMEIAKEFDEVFLQEIKEIYHLNNIGIVDEAQLPEEPYNINHVKDMIMFLAMGMATSFISMVIFYVFDNTIKKEEEIEKYIQLNSLGSIPINPDKKQEIVNRDNAKSYITECINTIRTNILYMNSAKNAKTILITSCTPREGKSWVSANIATAFAETDKKVLLIDGDMRKGRAYKIFKVANSEGLSNYLYDMVGNRKEDIKLGEKYIKETKIPNLHILTNGTIPPNPSELIESEEMKQLLDLLKDVYDVIIIDAPPCKLVTDSIILSRITDSTILVANSEKTKMNDFNEVKKSIQMVNGEIIGAILNKKKVAGKTYSKGYYYGHADTKDIEEMKVREIVSVESIIQEALLKLREKETAIMTEEIEETRENLEVMTDEDNYDKIENFVDVKLEELQEQNRDNNYIEKLNKISNQYQAILESIEEDKLKKEQVEEIIKQAIAEVDYTEKIEKVYSQLEETKSNTDEMIREVVEEVKEKYSQLTENMKDTTSNTNEMIKEIIEEVKENYNKLAEDIKDTTYVDTLLEKIEQEKLTKEQVEEIINKEKLTKKEIEEIVNKEKLTREQIEEIVKQEKLTKEQVENITKEVVKNSHDKLLDTIQEGKNSEQEMQVLLNEKITQMQENTQKLLQEEMTKIDYSEQIAQINDILNNLKDSYLELSNRIRMSEQDKEESIKEEKEKKQEEKQENKSKNIIDFKAFTKQRNKKKVYSIEEDIFYEDLEKSATYVIPLQAKKVSNGSAIENY